MQKQECRRGLSFEVIAFSALIVDLFLDVYHVYFEPGSYLSYVLGGSSFGAMFLFIMLLLLCLLVIDTYLTAFLGWTRYRKHRMMVAYGWFIAGFYSLMQSFAVFLSDYVVYSIGFAGLGRALLMGVVAFKMASSQGCVQWSKN